MIKSLVLDLGNVLFLFDHSKACEQIAVMSQQSVESISWNVKEGGWGARFERGQIAAAEFFRGITRGTLKDSQFQEAELAWNDIFIENKLMTNMIPIWQQSGLQLVLLSNTNELHYHYLATQSEIFRCFDHKVLSYEIGALKPEKAIFAAVLDRVSVAAHECFYIDDIASYTGAAGLLGFETHTYDVKDHHDLVDRMVRLGIGRHLI